MAPTAEPVQQAAIHDAVRRVTVHGPFARSARMRRFLTYLVDRAMAGESLIKEADIAAEVFDRDESFDPATDTIVRVEARRLRQNLANYYAETGSADPVVIEIPKGGYLPAFRSRVTRAQAPQLDRPPRRWRTAALLGITAGLAGLGLFWRGDRVPAAWHLEGTTLRITDERGRLCWQRDFGSIETASVNVIDKTLIGDVDGDGKVEVLFSYLPAKATGQGGELLCFDEGGRERWRFRMGAPKTFGERSFDGVYRGSLIRPVTVNGRPMILNVSNHYLWYPSQVALLDAKTGRMEEDYWHPGAIHWMNIAASADGPVAVFGAINNPGDGLGHAAAGILTIPMSKVRKRTYAPEDPFRPLTGGGESRYILLPLADLNRAMGVLPIITDFRVAGSRIVVEVPLIERGAIIYTLDLDLNLLETRFSDNFRALHRRLFLDHHLDHEISEDEIRMLGKAVRFDAAPDGNSPDVQRLWAF